MRVYVELFARTEPVFPHSEPVTSRNPESVVIDDLRDEIRKGTFSASGLKMLVIEHNEPLCGCERPTIKGPCVILREETT